MSKTVHAVDPSMPPREASAMMRKMQIRHLIVLDGENVVGILSRRDLINAFDLEVASGKKTGNVGQIMKSSVLTVGPDEPIEKASRIMARQHIGCLPVMNHGNLLGIITKTDIFKALNLLLCSNEDAVRITFDETDGDNALLYLENKTREMNLELLSFLSFVDRGRRMAVARVRGVRVGKFVDELWDSGHTVVNIYPMIDSELRVNERLWP